MMEWISEFSLTFGLIFISLILYLYRRRKEASRYPDGPLTFPILGNLPQIIVCGELMTFLEKYREIYGNVYTMELGGVRRVVISGLANIRELLLKQGDITSNRSTITMPKWFDNNIKGIIFGNYPDWKSLRTLAMTALRNEGMGKAAMEPKIMSELNHYISHFIEPNLGKPIEIELSLTFANSNIVCQMALGKRFEYDDPEVTLLNEAVIESFAASVKGSIARNIPFAKYIPWDFTGRIAQENADDYLVKTGARWLVHARKNLHEQDQNNFMHYALLHAEAEREKGKNEEYYSDKNIELAAIQMYLAGTETTSTTLKWGLLYMMLYPDIQERVRQEIHDVIGERTVTMKDKLSLPYCDAVIHEIMRYCKLGATILPHTLEKQLVVEGKVIPANTELTFNMGSLVCDPVLFPNPDKFEPERFLGEEGAGLKSKLVVFGLGRRACLGESLARMELLLFFVTFMQKYRVSYPPGLKPSLTPVVGFVRTPKKYKIIFERC